MNLDFWRELLDGLCAAWLGEDPALMKEAESVLAQKDFDGSQLVKLLSRWTGSHAPEVAERELHSLTALGVHNKNESVLRAAKAGDMGWMEGYGLPIQEEERALCRFLFAYPEEKLRKAGAHIVEALLHGFLSQSRDRRNRSLVRLSYCLGQEALALQVVRALKERGLRAIVQRPSCLTYSGAWALSHANHRAACLSAPSLEALTAAYDLAFRRNREVLLDTCGMIGIGQFGAAAGSISGTAGDYRPTAERRSRLMALENTKRSMEARYLHPSDLSFCKVAFPNLLVGENFPGIFEAFFRLNTMESEKYERIQQTLIDALDTCAAAELEGAAGNRTKLTVQLRPLGDSTVETNFLNCGGDLNVPHGELFTTPVLAGTDGVLHVKEIYLKDVFFQDLVLRFRDGMVVDYGCGNFDDPLEGRAYVREHLFQNHETLPMGEFAIGSNTLAYAIARDMDLMPRMPILLAEKMGPHIAVGDPCFARGEDAPVYNLYDHKEMVARENAITARRGEAEVYTNVHTDITLAFDELSRLDGVRADGTRVPILKDGRFVLPGTSTLNDPLEGKKEATP